MAFPAGDNGQRFEVSCYDESRGQRIIYGWADDPNKLVSAINLHPTCRDPQVRDRARAGG
jgi:hypothetical protein